MKDRLKNKIIENDELKELEELDLDAAVEISGGAGLRNTVSTPTKTISPNTKTKA